MDNATRFLKALTEIEDFLRDRLQRNEPGDSHHEFKSLITKYPNFVGSQRIQLKKCVDLRNAIVHDPGDPGGAAIADPRDTIVTWVEKQLVIVTKPPLVKDVLKLQPPRVLDEDDDLSEFLSLVRDQAFSQSPIRKKDGDLRLVTTNAVSRWLASEYEHANGALLESRSLIEMEAFSEASDSLAVKPRSLTAVEAVRIFAGEANRISPAAIILTDSGSAKQKPLGICSRADVATLLEALGV